MSKVRRFGNYNKLSNIEKLLENTPVSFYWIGFLLADGHFSNEKDCFLSIRLHSKDKNHLELLSDFLEYKSKDKLKKAKDGCFGFSCGDNVLIPKIMDKFGIKNRKTYNPPDNLPNFSKELMLALFIGFVDGDGNIRNHYKYKTAELRVTVHSSWLNILNQMIDIISDCCGENIREAMIDTAGCANLSIAKSSILKFIKNKAIEMNLPILTRKWNKIDLFYKNKRELGLEREKQILILKTSDFSIIEICKILKVTRWCVQAILIKNNLSRKYKKVKKHD